MLMITVGRIVGRRSRQVVLLTAALLLLAGSAPSWVGTVPRTLAGNPCDVLGQDPHTVPASSNDDFTFTLSGSVPLAWILLNSPSPNIQITNASSDWLPNVQFDSSHATYSGDAINPDVPLTVQLSVQVTTFDPTNWTIIASSNSDGSGAFACTGDTSISVDNTDTPPVITSLSASATTTNATVTWATDKNTNSRVDYGLTASYGQNVTDAAFSTSHELTISGLSPGTTYHYKVTSTDAVGTSTSSSDGTFITASNSTGGGGGGSGGSSGGGSSSPVNVKITTPTDKTPPTIRFSSTPPHIVNSEPSFNGTADDNVQVAKIEYSTDGGKNWLAADSTSGLTTKHATFSFKPLNLDDGSYAIIARATDGGGNSASTQTVTIIVDRFPPVAGGAIIALGPQVLVPDNDGSITTLPGVNLTVTLSAAGGANAVSINTMAAGVAKPAVLASFGLRQASDSGLWSGSMSFTRPGIFTLSAFAHDDAGNTTTRSIGTVRVVQSGSVLSGNGPVSGTVVTAYYRDPDSNGWTIWNGQPYGQINPQSTDKQGAFHLLLPPGTYYLHASASGHQDVTSASFTLTKPTPITAVLHMTPEFNIGPLYIPWFNFAVSPITNTKTTISTTETTQAVKVGQQLPNVQVVNTSNQTENNVTWLGKPTVITLLSTWVPTADEQLAILNQLASNSDVNVKVIGLQENAERLRAYNAIGGITLAWLADPHNQTAVPFGSGSIPMHIFVNRKGVVTDITYGVLTYQQLLDQLTSEL